MVYNLNLQLMQKFKTFIIVSVKKYFIFLRNNFPSISQNDVSKGSDTYMIDQF